MLVASYDEILLGTMRHDGRGPCGQQHADAQQVPAQQAGRGQRDAARRQRPIRLFLAVQLDVEQVVEHHAGQIERSRGATSKPSVHAPIGSSEGGRVWSSNAQAVWTKKKPIATSATAVKTFGRRSSSR